MKGLIISVFWPRIPSEPALINLLPNRLKGCGLKRVELDFSIEVFVHFTNNSPEKNSEIGSYRIFVHAFRGTPNRVNQNDGPPIQRLHIISSDHVQAKRLQCHTVLHEENLFYYWHVNLGDLYNR